MGPLQLGQPAWRQQDVALRQPCWSPPREREMGAPLDGVGALRQQQHAQRSLVVGNSNIALGVKLQGVPNKPLA